MKFPTSFMNFEKHSNSNIFSFTSHQLIQFLQSILPFFKFYVLLTACQKKKKNVPPVMEFKWREMQINL